MSQAPSAEGRRLFHISPLIGPLSNDVSKTLLSFITRITWPGSLKKDVLDPIRKDLITRLVNVTINGSTVDWNDMSAGLMAFEGQSLQPC